MLFKNNLIKIVSLSALVIPLTFSSSANLVHAKTANKTTTHKVSKKVVQFNNTSKSIGNGNEFVLTKPNKVKFVKITYGPNGVESKIVKTKNLKVGTKLYGFYKGTEGVLLCVYNFKAGVPITKDVWGSISLNNSNAKVTHKYANKYSYKYTVQQVLHQQY